MEEIINASSAPYSTEGIINTEGNNPQDTEVVDHWQETIKNDSSLTTINIDADVFMPTTDIIPVIEVAPYTFTEEDAKEYSDILLKDASQKANATSYSKQELEAMILSNQQEIEDVKANGVDEDDDMTAEERIKWLESEISELEKMYQDASDNTNLSLFRVK